MLEPSVWPEKSHLTDSALRLLAICGIVAPISFTTVVMVLGFIQPGYSHVSQAISELGAKGAPNATIQNINFFVTGLLTLAFAFGLHRGISGGKGSKVGPSLVAMDGLALVANGFLQCDAGCNFVTPTGILHDLTGLPGFAAISAAALILPRRLKTDAQLQSYRSFSVVAGLLMIVFLVSFVLSSGFHTAYRGAIQRLMAGTFLLWIEVMAIRLFQVSSHLRRRVAWFRKYRIRPEAFTVGRSLKSIAMGHEVADKVWAAPRWGRWLSAVLSVFACLDAMLAIVYSHRTAANPSLALQNHDIWSEAAFFAALYVGAALLVGSAHRLLIVAAAIALSFLGLVGVGDLVNARVLTTSAIGLLFLVGNLAGASVALAATVVVVLRPTARYGRRWLR